MYIYIYILWVALSTHALIFVVLLMHTGVFCVAHNTFILIYYSYTYIPLTIDNVYNYTMYSDLC